MEQPPPLNESPSKYPFVKIPDFIQDNPGIESHFYIPCQDSESKLATSLIVPLEESTDAAKRKKVVILCHGYHSWRNQMLLYELAAGITKELGYPTLRFDFEGNGHSTYVSDDQDRSRFSTQALSEVVEYVRKELDCKVICIMGHSLGSKTLMSYALERAEEIAKDGTILDPLSCDDFIRCYVNLAGPYPGRNIRKIKHASFLTIHGEEDEVLDVGHAYKVNEMIPNSKLCIVNAKHHLNVVKFMDKYLTNIEALLNES